MCIAFHYIIITTIPATIYYHLGMGCATSLLVHETGCVYSTVCIFVCCICVCSLDNTMYGIVV